MRYAIFDTGTPVGTILLAASDRGLRHLAFRPQPALARLQDAVEGKTALVPYIRQLREYLAGQRRTFDMPLDLRGTEFQLRCWNELLKVPYGQVISYATLAGRVDSPNGFRAVGHANGQNPIAIIVPCHRVISSDGTLGGYGGGLPMKQWLLDLERAVVPAQRQMSVFA